MQCYTELELRGQVNKEESHSKSGDFPDTIDACGHRINGDIGCCCGYYGKIQVPGHPRCFESRG